jgi:P4 family phage/plasmid primase-like protien
MNFTLSLAKCTGNAQNCLYPIHKEIKSEDDLKEAVAFDHVAGTFRKDYRSIGNFQGADCVIMDCDNDHTDDSESFITPEHITQALPDVSFAYVPSRNDGKAKGGKGPRPRGHYYFPIIPISDAEEYAALKRRIHDLFPFFDDNALDAARFLFGSPSGDLFWNEGWMTIDQELDSIEKEINDQQEQTAAVIHEGKRNNTLSRFAGRVLKRFGDCDRARALFMEEAAKCDPPMEDSELATIWASALKFYGKVKKQEGYVNPTVYNSEQGIVSLRPTDFSDMGQAKVFAREYEDELRYTDATDFIRFNGEFWEESRQQSVGAIEEFLDMQLDDAADQVNKTFEALLEAGVSETEVFAGGKKFKESLGDEQLQAYKTYLSALSYHAFVIQRRDYKYIVSALQATKPMVEMKVSDLDSNPFLLNTPGFTYDLRKGLEGRQEISADDYITKQTIASPALDGKAEWDNALDLFFCRDKELIEYVQQIVGLAAIGKVYFEALIIAYGEGSNGKSTFWNTISRVLGSYSGSISADALTVGCKRNVKPEMAELKGKRLIIAAELEEGMRLNTSVIKQLCSTDDISAEKKYKDPFRFTPSHTLVLYTNHLPRVGANDTGTWRRLIVIPFKATIKGGGDIKNYSEHLIAKAGPAVMAWIIQGAQKAIERGYHLAPPACVKDAINAYRDSNDWLGNFLGECCEIGSDLSEKSGGLYQAYRAYCTRNGEFTRNTSDFYTALDVMGFERKKTNKGNLMTGLKLREEACLD